MQCKKEKVEAVHCLDVLSKLGYNNTVSIDSRKYETLKLKNIVNKKLQEENKKRQKKVVNWKTD